MSDLGFATKNNDHLKNMNIYITYWSMCKFLKPQDGGGKRPLNICSNLLCCFENKSYSRAFDE